MNIFIMCDMEGISGIFCSDQVLSSGSRYAEGIRYMAEDINVCVKACREAGADKVYVRDGHGGGTNVLWEMLCPEADGYFLGNTGFERFPLIDECDAVILLGYHAMAGTFGGTLEHSMSSKSIQNYWINGELAGETAIDAGIVGEHGKPVIMVSGDDKVCAEAKALLPWVVTAEVKKGMSTQGALLLPKAKAHALLREKTIEAVKNAANAKPLVYEKPVTFRVELMERIALPNPMSRPDLKIIDGRTFEVVADTMEEALTRQ